LAGAVTGGQEQNDKQDGDGEGNPPGMFHVSPLVCSPLPQAGSGEQAANSRRRWAKGTTDCNEYGVWAVNEKGLLLLPAWRRASAYLSFKRPLCPDTIRLMAFWF
ncbi:MAG TPA: hypothetical protein PLK31_23625, partial [Chloroflexota bacterium]|nr:hypothetical protein [Chloroflexota bacterium]